MFKSLHLDVTQKEDSVKKQNMLFVMALVLGVISLDLSLLTVHVTPVYAQKGKAEICDNGVDDDGDKLVDCEDPDCKDCKVEGDCSPGFYKNHLDFWYGVYCGGDGEPDCDVLLDALTCKGSDASCGRSDAADYLNGVSGCTE